MTAKSKLELSQKSGIHSLLLKMAGDWAGTAKTWFEPGKLADESIMKGSIRPVLNGMFILHEYKGSLQGNHFEGISIYGYNLNDDKFQCTNIDSFHNGTAIMMQNGKEGSDKLSATGHYNYKLSTEETQTWGWRTQLELTDDNSLIITIYNITPQGEEAKGVEINYKRLI